VRFIDCHIKEKLGELAPEVRYWFSIKSVRGDQFAFYPIYFISLGNVPNEEVT